MLANRSLLAVFAVAGLALGIGAAILTPGSGNGFDPIHTMLVGTDGLLGVAFFFILADAVRVERPDFVMTLRILIGWLARVWLSLAAIAAGIAFFMVPGLYAAVKLAPWTAYYLLGADQALQQNLRDTTGYFWETCGFLVFAWLFPQLTLIAVALTAALCVVAFPLCAIVATPLLVLFGYYALTVVCLVWMHFSAALMRLGVTRFGAAVALPAP